MLYNQNVNTMFSLTNILKINAISSGLTGLGLVFFAQPVATLFQVLTTAPFLAVGVFLVFFASFVYWVAVQNPLAEDQVRTVIWLDSLWVVGSIIAIFLLLNSVSFIGHVIIGVVAVWVALMAILQQKGLKEKNARAY